MKKRKKEQQICVMLKFSLLMLVSMTIFGTPLQAQDIRTTDIKAQAKDGILLFRSENSDFAWWFDTRIFMDAAFYNEDKNDMSNGTEIRKARIALKAMLWRDWGAELDFGFMDNEVEIKDAWISYGNAFSSPHHIKAGNFKEPFSLEDLTSSKYLTFLERALPNVFPSGRKLGMEYGFWRKPWQFAAGIFGQELADIDAEEDEGFGLSGRLTCAPILESGKLLHLGLAGSYRTPDANAPEEISFRTYPETHVNRDWYLNTGNIEDVNNYTLIGLEAAGVYGPFSCQSEYIGTTVQRFDGKQDVNFSGSYVFGSWFITGESRSYDFRTAEFERLIPRSHHGALEVALRYSTLDLNDGDVTGGRAHQYTAGLNWYFNPNVRLLINYSIVDMDENANGDGTLAGNDDFQMFQFSYRIFF